MNKIPLLVELIGEEGTGKTHTGLLFPNPILLDCTEQGEGRLIAMKLFPSELDKRYKHITDWHDLLSVPDGFDTYVFDTSKDVVRLMSDKWCDKYKKKQVYPPQAYGQVYNMLDKLIRSIMHKPANVVMTSVFRDEYIDDKKTGKRERDGYKRLRFESWLRFHITIEYKVNRVYTVIKNRFVDKTSDDYVSRLTEFSFNKLIEITFDKVGFDKSLVVI